MKRYNKLITITFISFFLFPAIQEVHAEHINLHEILHQLGLQPTHLELKYVKKGGSLTAVILDASKLSGLGFKNLKENDRIHLQNMGDQHWMIIYPPTKQKAKITVSRQNKPAKKPRIRIKLLYIQIDES